MDMELLLLSVVLVMVLSFGVIFVSWGIGNLLFGISMGLTRGQAKKFLVVGVALLLVSWPIGAVAYQNVEARKDARAQYNRDHCVVTVEGKEYRPVSVRISLGYGAMTLDDGTELEFLAGVARDCW